MITLFGVDGAPGPTPGDIQALRDTLDGHLLTRDDDGFAAAIQIDNGLAYSERVPLLLVYPQLEADVGLAMDFARRFALPFTVKGGGHSAAAYSLNKGGLVLDTTYYWNEVDFEDENEESLRVGAGARWKEVYEFLQDTERVVVGGTCTGVGVTGFMLGGGISFLSRSYGLGVDNVESFSLVLANGTRMSLTRDYLHSTFEEDLFWALSGGGGGNFGVFSSMTIALHRLPSPTVLVGSFCWEDPSSYKAPLLFYSKWIRQVPNQLAVYVMFSASRMCWTAVYNGKSSAGRPLLDPIIRQRPSTSSVVETKYLDYLLTVGNRTEIHGAAYITSGILPEDFFTDSVIDAVLAMVTASPNPDNIVLWTHVGGAIDKVPTDASAFYHRKALFDFEIKAMWRTPHGRDAAIAWALNSTASISSTFLGAYVNYIDPLLAGWQRAYYGENYNRLLRIKKEVDPDNFFTFQQSIGSP